ncbi:uncharacterized protein [Haliotis asinina]|uniref:uncharacterized protein n=1 Tax=Haliotis asinina TaxID=109174 RepID=UPI00353251A2
MERSVIQGSSGPWYKHSVHHTTCERRRGERKWRKSPLEADRQSYKTERNKVCKVIRESKRLFCKEQILDSACKPKTLHKFLDSLMAKKKSVVLPQGKNPSELADLFNLFFKSKIDDIRKLLLNFTEEEMLLPHSDFQGTHLLQFQAFTKREVRSLVMSSNKTTCLNDPIPTSLLIEHLDLLLLTLTEVINKTMSSGIFPHILKDAVIKPLVKNPKPGKKDFKNYLPVSNLTFLSKLLREQLPRG